MQTNLHTSAWIFTRENGAVAGRTPGNGRQAECGSTRRMGDETLLFEFMVIWNFVEFNPTTNREAKKDEMQAARKRTRNKNIILIKKFETTCGGDTLFGYSLK
jgi:hypothetical protein